VLVPAATSAQPHAGAYPAYYNEPAEAPPDEVNHRNLFPWRPSLSKGHPPSDAHGKETSDGGVIDRTVAEEIDSCRFGTNRGRLEIYSGPPAFGVVGEGTTSDWAPEGSGGSNPKPSHEPGRCKCAMPIPDQIHAAASSSCNRCEMTQPSTANSLASCRYSTC
jgi:hypothetical protein